MSRTKTLHPAAVAAAQWWAEQVTGSPTFRATVPGEPGGESAELASMMATILAARHEPAEGTGELFAALLAGVIDADLRPQLERGRVWLTLGCDYGPDRMLAEVAESAGISLSRFPWKTTQWIQPDHVTVSLGYQAPTRLVWSSEDWQRPTCPDHRWLRNDDNPYTNDLCGLPQYHEGDHDYTRTDDRTCSECGLDYAGHHNADRAAAGWHGFETAAEVPA